MSRGLKVPLRLVSHRVGISIFEYRYYRNTEIVFSDFLNIEINIDIQQEISILSKLISIFKTNFDNIEINIDIQNGISIISKLISIFKTEFR